MKTESMDIKSQFLKLTSRTYPHGTEAEIFGLLPELQKDEFGNLFARIGEGDVMFTSHLDTATSANVAVKHVIEGSIIKTDGTTILGADDKAGVAIMLHMMERGIPGLYYFFLGEEVGCVGSKKLAAAHRLAKLEEIRKVVSFDRRGTDSVITYQSGMRCCSDKFGEALALALNTAQPGFEYKCDPTGLLTDSLQFIEIYAECTNISVGYQNEHTFSERQDIDHLARLAEACVAIDWNSLPVERDPSQTEYMGYTERYLGKAKYYDYYDDYYDEYPSYGGCARKKEDERIDNFWFHDEKHNHLSKLQVNSKKKILSVDLCQERIGYEVEMIEEFLSSIELEYKRLNWDGMKLKVFYDDKGHETECDRNELLEYIPKMDYQKTKSEYSKRHGGDYYDYDYDYLYD